ncbi:MAG: serine protease [Caldilineaceae bacterium]
MRQRWTCLLSILLFVWLLLAITGQISYAQQYPTADDTITIPTIVGGQAADPGEYPWQAMLLDSSGYFYCGGTLIQPEWILTAGHCTYGVTPTQVVLGAHSRNDNRESGRQTIAVKQVYRHPQFSPSSLVNDIALLQLSGPATLTKAWSPLRQLGRGTRGVMHREFCHCHRLGHDPKKMARWRLCCRGNAANCTLGHLPSSI